MTAGRKPRTKEFGKTHLVAAVAVRRGYGAGVPHLTMGVKRLHRGAYGQPLREQLVLLVGALLGRLVGLAGMQSQLLLLLLLLLHAVADKREDPGPCCCCCC